MRGARLEALDELDLLGQHRLLTLELRLLLLLVQRPLLFVELVVARIGGQRAAIDLDHLVDDAVHERAIMRGHQQRALIAGEELLQPDQALQIEMVARLVQQHHVGAHEQNAGQCHAHLPAAREIADISIHHLLAEAEPGQHFARPAFQRIAAERLEPALDFAEAFDDRVERVGLCGVAHRGFERMQLGGDDADIAGAVHHLGHSAAAGHLADILAEEADADAAIEKHLALIGLLLAGDHAEKRGLAGAVGADKADLLALLEGGGGLDEEELVAVLLADSVEADHGYAELGTVAARLWHGDGRWPIHRHAGCREKFR